MPRTTSPTDTVQRCYETQDWDGLAALYAPDVLLDMHPTGRGVIVEWEMHTGHGDREQLCRQVDILHGDGATITEHVVFCGGMWDPATIARQRAEAPMVRW